MLLIYNILLWLSVPFVTVYYGVKIIFTGKYKKGLAQRFGIFPPEITARMKGAPRIWLHAVSVGEVTAAAPIIAALRQQLPDACIVLSITTETGLEMARQIVAGADAFIFYPLDMTFAARKTIDLVRPDVFALVETELWPNFIGICRSYGVKIVMTNGRLSPRSFRKYALTRFFWNNILSALDEVGVISEADGRRFRFLGVPEKSLHVFGNAKYDSLAAKASPLVREEMSLLLDIEPGERVFMAGSTHDGEESVVLGVYKELLKNRPDFKLIIVPRHVERAQAVMAMAKEAGFEDIITITEITRGKKRQGERIIVVDAIGKLFKIYALATVVFCGGSLVPRGGQNILEAAAWGKVVFYGPFMDDFREEKAMLEEAGAGITVKNGDDLLAGILKMTAEPDDLARRGERGRRMIAANMGAAGRYAELIKACLPPLNMDRGS